jgi:hypothetical protein
MRKIILTILLVLIWTAAYCCDCKKLRSIKEAIQNADAVFIAEAISFNSITFYDSSKIKDTKEIDIKLPSRTFHEYKFRVYTFFKGETKQDTITLLTDISTCGSQFTLGDWYIIYSDLMLAPFDRSETPKKYQNTNACTRTRSIIDIAEINELTRLTRLIKKW